MCDEQVLVPIPEKIMPFIYEFDQNHCEYGIDDEGRKCLRLDKCIVPLITKLWEGDFSTTSCCCGHGSYGVVGLMIDGKEWALVEIGHPHCGVGWVEDQHEFHEWRTRNYPKPKGKCWSCEEEFPLSELKECENYSDEPALICKDCLEEAARECTCYEYNGGHEMGCPQYGKNNETN